MKACARRGRVLELKCADRMGSPRLEREYSFYKWHNPSKNAAASSLTGMSHEPRGLQELIGRA